MELKIEGRYFERKQMESGTMGTIQTKADDLHYFVRETEAGDIRLELVDKKGNTTGTEVETITKEEFAQRFKPCMEHDCFFRVKTPEEIKKKKQEEIEDTAEKHLKNREFNSAEYEFGRALKVDEESVRSNYGMGKVYLETGRKEEAKKVFDKLSKIEALFEEENKHIFNEFGIDLRREGMFDEAIANYEKAISIAPDDAVLYYNLARAYKETGDLDKAMEKIRRALVLEPNFEEAREYLPYLVGKAADPGAE